MFRLDNTSLHVVSAWHAAKKQTLNSEVLAYFESAWQFCMKRCGNFTWMLLAEDRLTWKGEELMLTK